MSSRWVGLRRDYAAELKFDSKVTPSKLFSEVEKIGVVVSDHMVAAQPLPGSRFDLTFKSPAIRDRFLPDLESIPDSKLFTYGGYVIVNVFNVLLDIDDNIVRARLAKYGEVLAGRVCTFAERPSLFNGTRQYKMRVKNNIPSVLRIGSSNAWVSYVGQTRTCARCGATGHMASACDIIKCYKCLGLGHAAAECPNRVVCTVCEEEGHKLCPNSFANRANPTKRWSNVVAAKKVNPSSGPDSKKVESSPLTGFGGGGLPSFSVWSFGSCRGCEGGCFPFAVCSFKEREASSSTGFGGGRVFSFAVWGFSPYCSGGLSSHSVRILGLEWVGDVSLIVVWVFGPRHGIRD